MPKKSKKQTGKGLKEIITAIPNFIKDNRLISKGLKSVGPYMYPVGVVADAMGYGRKKRAPRARKAVLVQSVVIPKVAMQRRRLPAHIAHGQVGQQLGTGFFSDLGGGIGSVFGGLGGGLGSVAHGLFGAGRKTSNTSRSVIVI